MKVDIRKLRKTDRATLDELYADEEVLKHVWIPSIPSTKDAWNRRCFHSQYRKSLKKRYRFTIWVDGKIAGDIELVDPSFCRSTYEVGFGVGRKFWNQGICTEALKQIVRFAFDELKIHKIVGDNDADNPASGRVFEKAGFKREGVFKEHYFRDGKYVDVVHWGLINPVDEQNHDTDHLILPR
jgi:RimJ/RimL family protein N-acetyltransferase